MGQPTVKTSFAGGEFAPKLIARVDLAKYHTGAALMRNFFVDYSGGGASTRPGTKFINQVKTAGARLIEFQPSTTLSFVLEFGQNYIRFYSNGAAILEAAVAIQSITGSPVTVNSTANGYANGDWVFISGAYYIVTNAATNSYQLTDLFGNNVLALTGTQAQRVYTLTTSYNAVDLFANPATGNPGLKFLQDVTSLIICHPNYPPAVLTELSANNWTLSNISFAPTIDQPIVSNSTVNPGTSWTYFYIVTAVDANGQESSSSSSVSVTNGLITSLTSPITNTLTWPAVTGATSYNIYRSVPFQGSAPTITTAAFGFIANIAPGTGSTTITFQESSPGISPDFSQGPPISPNSGSSVQRIVLSSKSNITQVPSVAIAAPPSGITALAIAIASPTTATIGSLSVSSTDPNQQGAVVSPVGAVIAIGSVTFKITSAVQAGANFTVTGLTPVGNVSTVGASLTTSFTFPLGGTWGSPPGTDYIVKTSISNGSVTVHWQLSSIKITNSGSGYTTAPTVTFTNPNNPATATAIIQTFGGAAINPLANGNPGVPGFLQERLTLAGPLQAVQSYVMSQPGFFFNFNTSFPTQDDDAISGSIIGEELNDIRSLISVPTGLIALTGKGAWLINGGGGISSASPITPANQAASPQAFNGANDLKPIKNNLDVLYGTNKGNYVRDLAYNIYANIYTGTDISVFSNHLFFGYYLLDWAWAEEPFKTLWSIRNDGTMLSLGYVKEQEVIGWAQHDTDGQFLSACSVIENVGGNIVDAVYLIVQRLINGQLVQYVERLADRYFPYGYEDSWSVDCALQTQPQSSPTGTLTFTGNASAVGNVVTLTDIADAPFTAAMATNGWVVRAGGGIYKITAFTSTSIVTASVVRVPVFINPYTSVPFPISTGYTIWQPVTTVSGLTQLVGKTVTGVADGAVVSPQVVSASGTITLATAASKITLGLAFTPQLQTLPLDLGQPTVQGKRKKLPSVTLRVADTLGLQVGTTFANAVSMKDFVIGAIPTLSFGVTAIADLVNPSYNPTGVVIDGWQLMDQVWQEAGQLCIQQNLPYPATVIGVFPEVVVGDTK